MLHCDTAGVSTDHVDTCRVRSFNILRDPLDSAIAKSSSFCTGFLQYIAIIHELLCIPSTYIFSAELELLFDKEEHLNLK